MQVQAAREPVQIKLEDADDEEVDQQASGSDSYDDYTEASASDDDN
jgi:hypothetical protein